MSKEIQKMFGLIAGDYNKMNRLMTFGMDNRWRKAVVRLSGVSDGDQLLDVATGTGDILFLALRQFNLKASGLDFSKEMLDVARRRDRRGLVQWIQGDALELPFEEESFDAVTSGYLMRNAGDIEKAFAEQYRVLKPGGTVVCLDTTPPPNNILGPFIRFYLKRIIPLVGTLVTGNRSAYKYLTESTVNFKSADEIRRIMERAGFTKVSIKKYMAGTIAIHRAIKEDRV